MEIHSVNMEIKHALKQKQIKKEMVKSPQHTIRENCLQTPRQKMIFRIKQKTHPEVHREDVLGGRSGILWGERVYLEHNASQEMKTPAHGPPSPSGHSEAPLPSQHIPEVRALTLLWRAAPPSLCPWMRREVIFQFTLLFL